MRATAKDNRLFVEAVLYRYRAGIPWRDLPLGRKKLRGQGRPLPARLSDVRRSSVEPLRGK